MPYVLAYWLVAVFFLFCCYFTSSFPYTFSFLISSKTNHHFYTRLYEWCSPNKIYPYSSFWFLCIALVFQPISRDSFIVDLSPSNYSLAPDFIVIHFLVLTKLSANWARTSRICTSSYTGSPGLISTKSWLLTK